MAAVMIRKQTHEWIKENRKYVPHAATFLNQERWKDASAEESEKVSKTPSASSIPVLEAEPWAN